MGPQGAEVYEFCAQRRTDDDNRVLVAWILEVQYSMLRIISKWLPESTATVDVSMQQWSSAMSQRLNALILIR